MLCEKFNVSVKSLDFSTFNIYFEATRARRKGVIDEGRVFYLPRQKKINMNKIIYLSVASSH